MMLTTTIEITRTEIVNDNNNRNDIDDDNNKDNSNNSVVAIWDWTMQKRVRNVSF